MTTTTSAVIQSMLPKLKDGSFSFLCQLGATKIGKALCDLRANISLIPLSICRKFVIGKIKSTSVPLKMADRSVKFLIRVLEDVPVKVGTYISPLILSSWILKRIPVCASLWVSHSCALHVL